VGGLGQVEGGGGGARERTRSGCTLPTTSCCQRDVSTPQTAPQTAPRTAPQTAPQTAPVLRPHRGAVIEYHRQRRPTLQAAHQLLDHHLGLVRSRGWWCGQGVGAVKGLVVRSRGRWCGQGVGGAVKGLVVRSRGWCGQGVGGAVKGLVRSRGWCGQGVGAVKGSLVRSRGWWCGQGVGGAVKGSLVRSRGRWCGQTAVRSRNDAALLSAQRAITSPTTSSNNTAHIRSQTQNPKHDAPCRRPPERI